MKCTQVLATVVLSLLGTQLFAGGVDRPPRIDRPSAPKIGHEAQRVPSLLARRLNTPATSQPADLWEIFRTAAVNRPAAKEFLAHPAFLGLGEPERLAFVTRIACKLPDRFLAVQDLLLEEDRQRALPIALAQIESRLIRRLSRLPIEKQLEYLLAPHVAGDEKQRARALARLNEDPALRLLTSIHDTWLSGLASEQAARGYLHTSPREMLQTKVMIARNLFFQSKQPTRANVRTEYRRILLQRQRYQEVALFASRQVLYAASSRKLKKDGSFVFGRPTHQRRLTRQGVSLSFFRPGQGEESPDETKRRLSNQIQMAVRPTLLFEGDGRENALQFHGALSAKDLAKRLSRRQSPDLFSPGDLPIVILSACRGHNVGRAILAQLDALDPSIQKPIIIVPGEYGQDFAKFLYNDPFLGQELQLQSATETTVGSLLRNGEIRTSVYVPDENNVPVQIL